MSDYILHDDFKEWFIAEFGLAEWEAHKDEYPTILIIPESMREAARELIISDTNGRQP